MAIDLRGRERRVPEQFLDHAQVRAAFEEMCGERVAEPVRVAEEPAHGARVELSAARGEEERVDGPSSQLGPSIAQVAGHMVCRLFSERHDSLFAALSPHMHGLALEVHVGKVEPHGFGAPEPTRVQELEERAIPEGERRVAVRELQQMFDLGDLRRVGKMPRSSWSQQSIGDGRRAECETNACSYRSQSARDRCRREPVAPGPEIPDPVCEDAGVDVVEAELMRVEPRREGPQIGAVRPTGRLGQAAVLEEAIDGGVGVHGHVFAFATASPPGMGRVRCGHLRNPADRRTLIV